MNKVLIHKLLGLFVVCVALTLMQGCSFEGTGVLMWKFHPGALYDGNPNLEIDGRSHQDGDDFVVIKHEPVSIKFNPNTPSKEWVLSGTTRVTVDNTTFTRGSFTEMDLQGFTPSFGVRHPGFQATSQVRVSFDYVKRGTGGSYSAELRRYYEQKELNWISEKLRKEDKSDDKVAWKQTCREVRTLCLQVMTGSMIPDQDQYRAVKLKELMSLATAKDPSVAFKIRRIFLDKLMVEEMSIVVFLHFGQVYN